MNRRVISAARFNMIALSARSPSLQPGCEKGTYEHHLELGELLEAAGAAAENAAGRERARMKRRRLASGTRGRERA